MMLRNLALLLLAFILPFFPTRGFSQTVGMSPPSILRQCLKGPAIVGAGPSARERECTRQYCAQPEYRTKVTAYAKSQPQSKSDAVEALTCITRWERDQGKK